MECMADAWSWRCSFRLFLLRIVYFAIVGIYVATALWICGQALAPAAALAVIPLVLVATILPIARDLAPVRPHSICCFRRSSPTFWWRWA